jgi:flagellar biosynthesis protein FlhG
MNKLPYGIVVSSQKGGVGKTTVAVNLGIALNARGYKVLLIDGDYANPTVGFHLGLEKVNIGLRSVLNGESELRNSVVSHNPTGMHILPNEVVDKPFRANTRQVLRFYEELTKSNYDFIVMDTAPGPLPEQLLSVFKRWKELEILILLTPEAAACMSALRLGTLYNKLHVSREFAVNRIKYRGYELSLDDIEDVCGEKLLGAMPEDEHVPISIAEHIPLYLLAPNSNFSKEMRSISRHYARGITTEPEGEISRRGRWSFWIFIRDMLSRIHL